MRMYYPEFHTPENLRDQVAEVYNHYPDMLVVGSLGRATVFNTYRGDSNYEFTQRHQHPLHNGDTARDIDVIGADQDHVARTLPFWVDATSYDIGGTQIAQQNGEWFISVDGYYEAQLHPATMEPIEAETIYDMSCLAVPPETQMALLRVRGQLREKDVLISSIFSDLIGAIPAAKRLSSELFEPFEAVHQIN